MKSITTTFVAITALVLVGCANGSGPKQTAGTLLGAAGGGLAGAQFGRGKGQLAAVAAGALLGAFIGNEVGLSLDRADREYAQRNAQRTLEYAPSGQTSGWVNPDSGNSGSVTPTSTYQSPEGRYCREYQTRVVVGGRESQGYGTACRQPDGSGQIANN